MLVYVKISLTCEMGDIIMAGSITGIRVRSVMCSGTFFSYDETVVPFVLDESSRVVWTRRHNGIDQVVYRADPEKIKIMENIISSMDIDTLSQQKRQIRVSDKVYLTDIDVMYDDGTVVTLEDTGRSDEFLEALRSIRSDDNKISDGQLYPSIAELMEIKEEHGPVVGIEKYAFSSGMMVNSNVSRITTIDKIGDGKAKVSFTYRAGNLPEIHAEEETECDIFGRLNELSEKENIPALCYAHLSPDAPREIVYDYSSSASISLIYDDSAITGVPRVKKTLGDDLWKLKGDLMHSVNDIINEVCNGTSIDFNPAWPGPGPQAGSGNNMGMWMMTMTPPAPVPQQPAQTSTDDGEWLCTCGTKNTGKFCYNCGMPRTGV